MKKLSILIAFLTCAIVTYSQLTPVPRGNATQIDQFRGAVTGLNGTILWPKDTTNHPATPYFGALTVLPSDAGLDTIPIWMSNGNHWIRFNSGNAVNINDTIYTRLPIYIDTTSVPGRRIITLLHADGIISGGLVSQSDCWEIQVTPVTYSLNYVQYNITTFTTLSIDTADATFPRTDAIIVDTSGQVLVLTGIPSSLHPAPIINPSSQILITTIDIDAGATCLAVEVEIIYDGAADDPAQWTPTTTGTGTTSFTNTANPYHLNQAAFTSIYNNGYTNVFTKPSGVDTVEAGEILKAFIYFFPFQNQLQGQWFNGSTAVSNAIVLNPYFNVNDTNFYQLFVVPLSAWSWPGGNIFNKFVITFAGTDASGSRGVYMDWIQLQTGIVNAIEPPPPAWYTGGNTLTNPGVNFLGTIDNKGLMFKVAGVQSGYLDLNFNTSFGRFSLINNTTGFSNNAIGYATLFTNTTGNHNTGQGYKTLNFNTTGSRNTAVGYEALYNNTTGSYNIGLGYQFDDPNTTRSNTFSISDSTTKMYMRIDTATGTAPSIIGYNPVTKMWNHYATAALYTASNGLQLSSNDFQLGSNSSITAPTFATNRFINAQNFQLTLTGTSNNRLQLTSTTTGSGLSVSTQTGTGVTTSTNGGIGFRAIVANNSAFEGSASNSSDIHIANFEGGYTSTNTVVPAILIRRLTSSAGSSVGIGASIDFSLGGASPGAIQPSSKIVSLFTGVAPNFNAQLEFHNVNNNSYRRNMAIATTGQITLDQYTTSNFNGGVAADSVLVVTSTGVVLKRDAASFGSGGGGGSSLANVYLKDSALSSNRIIDLNGKSLNFRQSGDPMILLDPVGFESTLSTSDGTATSFINIKGDSGGGQVFFNLNSTDGGNTVNLSGDAPTNTLSYTADQHTFNAPVSFQITDGSNNNFLFDPVNANASIIMSDNGIAISYLQLQGSNTGNDVYFNLNSTDGTNTVAIKGDAIADTVGYLAENHIFRGSVGVNQNPDDNGRLLDVYNPIAGVSSFSIDNAGKNVYLTAYDPGGGNSFSSYLALGADASGPGAGASIASNDAAAANSASLTVNGYQGVATLQSTNGITLSPGGGPVNTGITLNSAVNFNSTTISTTGTLSAAVFTAECDSGPYNINLPDATLVLGRVYVIKNIDVTGTITVVPNGAQTIDGAANYPLATQYKYVMIQANPLGKWSVIGNN